MTTPASIHQRIPLQLLGRTVGTYRGWDDLEGDGLVFYEVLPAPLIAFPSGDVTVDFLGGRVLTHDLQGQVLTNQDLFEIIKDLPTEA